MPIDSEIEKMSNELKNQIYWEKKSFDRIQKTMKDIQEKVLMSKKENT
jgi:hypothetical protein